MSLPIPKSKSALMAFFVATVTADELEKPPCGISPVDTTRSPRKPSRPRNDCTFAPILPSRTVRMEAMALPTNEKGLRMLLTTHSEGGGRGCCFCLRDSNSESLKKPNESSKFSAMRVPNPS